MIQFYFIPNPLELCVINPNSEELNTWAIFLDHTDLKAGFGSTYDDTTEYTYANNSLLVRSFKNSLYPFNAFRITAYFFHNFFCKFFSHFGDGNFSRIARQYAYLF